MYARRTKVPTNQTRAEIERLLEKEGASARVIGEQAGQAMLMFEMRGWRLKFLLPLPVTKRADQERKNQQETRRRWRALKIVLVAKLEAVDSGIIEFEREFLAHIVTNGGSNATVGDQVLATLPQLVSSGKLPPLLGPGGAE